MSQTSISIESEVNELYAKAIVTQKIKNESEYPLELKIYVYKKKDCLFSSFKAKIGDSISVKSKVIKKEEAEIKYTDSISQGNAAIFVSNDPKSENRIIINLGNIPPKEELTFISEFIYFTESSETYEFELFRNLPILAGDNCIYQNSSIKGKVNIRTKNKINKIEKGFLSKNITIIEEKYLDDNKNNYLIKYEFNNVRKISIYYLDNVTSYEEYTFIPSLKISFELESNEQQAIIFSQNSSLNEKEKCYTIQYRNISKKSENKEDLKLNPALFIFLIDQSGSMKGTPIKLASEALLLFLQSLPAGSYYQIIGFGSEYKKYDKIPKKYESKNIKESIKLIKNLEADLGGTDIYSPLKNIYDSFKIYDKIYLPRNIFLLTDGEIDDKKETLDIIENNSDLYSIYSIGIGNCFDRDLIKNAGIIGKGNYNFCCDIQGLNEVIATEVCKACSSYASDFCIKTNLDDKKLYRINNTNNLILRKNKIIDFNYIIEKNEGDNDNNKINIDIKYRDNDNNKKDTKKEINENYEIIPYEISKGEELSKIIINNYLLKSPNIDKEKKIKLALKYQILTDFTSLFAEVELSEKISEKMKLKIIGDKENNIIKIYQANFKKSNDIEHYDYEYRNNKINYELCACPPLLECSNEYSSRLKCSNEESLFEKNMEKECCPPKCSYEELLDNNCNEECSANEIPSEKAFNEEKMDKFIKKKEEIDLNKKEDLMKIINTQDFVDGFWDINELTKIIKENYEKEFKLINQLKDKKIDDKIIMTVLIIYFIHKEHPELLKELIMIINKGKNYIQEKTENTYDNIIKEIGIN